MGRNVGIVPPSGQDYTPERALLIDRLLNGGVPGTVKAVRTGYYGGNYTGEVAADGSGAEDRRYVDITVPASGAWKCVVQVAGFVVDPNDSANVHNVLIGRMLSSTVLRVSVPQGVQVTGHPSLLYFRFRWTLVEYY